MFAAFGTERGLGTSSATLAPHAQLCRLRLKFDRTTINLSSVPHPLPCSRKGIAKLASR